MNIDFLIKMCRGSIFAPTVSYNEDTWEKLAPKFIGFLPSEKGSPTINLQGNLIQLGGPTWVLSSKKENIEIHFLEGKIDVIILARNSIYTSETIESLCLRVKDIFEKIVTTLDLKATRLAFSPLLLSRNTEHGEIIEFVRSIFNNRTFKGERIDNCDFSNVFRIRNDINGTGIVVNHLANFSVTQNPIEESGKLIMREALQLNVDINTIVGKNYIFSIEDINDFFSKSSSLTVDFVSSYFE